MCTQESSRTFWPFSPGVHLVPHMHNDSMVSNHNSLDRPICCYETAVLCMACGNGLPETLTVQGGIKRPSFLLIILFSLVIDWLSRSEL